MKKFICSLLPFLLLSAGCAGAAPAETAQSLESVEETESLPEESPFEEPEYEYILNNPYQSYVRYYDGSTWAVTEEGLFVHQDGSDSWECVLAGKVGIGDSFDVLNGWIYYQDDDGKLIRQSIKEPHRKETV